MTLKYNSITTLNFIREAEPCNDGWTKLLSALGKTKADDEPLPLLAILDSNGLDDALWVLSYAIPPDRLARHFQAWCAEQVLHIFEAKYPNDTRIRAQIEMLKNDEATDEERSAAWAAARASARDATGDAAWASAWGATGDAARGAVGDAARASAWGATGDAARGAASTAARNAAWDAARAAQESKLREMLIEEENT